MDKQLARERRLRQGGKPRSGNVAYPGVMHLDKRRRAA
jgi:hypothetical protein